MRVVKVVLPFLLLAVFPALGMSATSDAFSLDVALKADKQCELSQRIAKDYLAHGTGVWIEKSKSQLDAAVQAYRNNARFLKQAVKSPAVQKLLAEGGAMADKYLALVAEPYSRKNAADVLEMSETVLQVDSQISGKLDDLANLEPASILGLSNELGMLSQRMAKLYIACKADMCNQATLDMLDQAVTRFGSVQKNLLAKSQGIADVHRKLVQNQRLWSLVRGMFVDARSGNVPVMVFSTADVITRSMARIAELSVKANADSGSDGQLLTESR